MHHHMHTVNFKARHNYTAAAGRDATQSRCECLAAGPLCTLTRYITIIQLSNRELDLLELSKHRQIVRIPKMRRRRQQTHRYQSMM